MTDPPSDWPSAVAVAEAFGLPGRVGELVPVAGAWSNRVYRLQVGDAAFAVKELLDTWRQPTWFECTDGSSRDLGPEEQERGEALVPDLLDRLPRRVPMAEHIHRWLAS